MDLCVRRWLNKSGRGPGPTALTAFFLAIIAGWGCATARAPLPSRPSAASTAPSAQPGLVGKWVGPTQEDGTLEVEFNAAGRFAYRYGGGKKEHGTGRYKVEGNQITVLEDGDRANEAEIWTFGLGQGRMRLRMPDDDEVYLLTRQGP